MLKLNKDWRFHSPRIAPPGLVRAFSDFIGRITNQVENRQRILEDFKGYFAGAAGLTANTSSSESWAASDLEDYMSSAAANAPLFIAAFYDCCEDLQKRYPDIALPNLMIINNALRETECGYEIQPPDLISVSVHAPVAVRERVKSFSERMHEIIGNSLASSEKLMSEGRSRPAVQEALWLLETVSTAFRGLETDSGAVQGKYFNAIVDDLRRHHKGKVMGQVLNWMTTLHGFLSSPTGGGIRHGADLKADIDLQPNDARLFCDLIRSFTSFLMAEHERLNGTNG